MSGILTQHSLWRDTKFPNDLHGIRRLTPGFLFPTAGRTYGRTRCGRSTMPMEGDLYTFLLSLFFVGCLLYWARDLADQPAQAVQKKRKP